MKKTIIFSTMTALAFVANALAENRIQYSYEDASKAAKEDGNIFSWKFSDKTHRTADTLTAATPVTAEELAGGGDTPSEETGSEERFSWNGSWRDESGKITQESCTNFCRDNHDNLGIAHKGSEVVRLSAGVTPVRILGDGLTYYGSVGDNFGGGRIDEDGSCACVWSCFSADTPITLANGSTKRADEITYDDELLVWNFDEGKFDKAKSLWLKKPEVATEYNYLKFSDGSVFKTIDQHRIFNREAGKFTYPMTDETPLGTHTLNAKGEWVELVEKRVIYEEVVFYNIITYYHINCFAGNVLASCRFNNLYPIKDLKFVKDNRSPVPYEEYAELDKKWYDGLRLSEQPREVNKGNDVHHAESVVEHIKNVYIKNAQQA